MNEVAKRFHEEWLGLVQPVDGLVVSIPVLLEAECLETEGRKKQPVLHTLCPEATGEEGVRRIRDLAEFLEAILDLKPARFHGQDELPEALKLYVPEGHQTLRPSLALKRPHPDGPGEEGAASAEVTPASQAGAAYQMLLWDLPAGLDLDQPETATGDWMASPAVKFERLLRACRVPVGLLTHREVVRLVYAPHGASSGSITFRVDHMARVEGRPILDAFCMLLSKHRWFQVEPENTLPGLLARSRKHQASVTNTLAAQVFEALQILLDGFQAASERDGDTVLREALERSDDQLYGGLLTVLLRLVFVLYAEDRDLLPTEVPLYAEQLSLTRLFQDLQEDQDAYPDSMARRFGAWGRLLALFRAIYLGADHGAFQMPARYGDLFDPHRYPFLEGWGPAGSAPISRAENRGEVRVPTVDDETVYRVLHRLVILEGQRLSYRALDVEQIGSVYEALMGHHVVRLDAPGVCLRPARVWVTANDIAAQPKGRLATWLKEEAGLSKASAESAAKALKAATDVEGVLSALEAYRMKTTPRAPVGKLVIQPGVERRRTSSHYTPRTLSAPIVQKTLEPLIAAMGEAPSSDQLLNLVICDPAMGSGAFLVEAARYLGDQVVAAWTREERLDKIADAYEDVTNHARRLVAQRCLYGVDKNPFAVSLAKLSLWLVTLSKAHPFTFVDHALKCGDSLVGLSLDQIKAFHWQPKKQVAFCEQELGQAFGEAFGLRRQILALAHQDDDASLVERGRLLRDADDALDRVRLIGDLVVGAFFSATQDKAREAERKRRLDRVEAWLAEDDPGVPEDLLAMQAEIRARLPVFHWMVEFPEVFAEARPDPLDGNRVNAKAMVDGFIGNPPFGGKNAIADFGGEGYLDWLKTAHDGSHGNADYSAHFFRRTDALLGEHGTLGLIATNTIAQGDTRTTGLKRLVANGHQIYDAVRNRPWGEGAAVTVAIIHTAKGKTGDRVAKVLDGEPVADINSRLRPKPERGDPLRIVANSGCSFQGTVVLGMGFTLTPEERDALVAKDARNAARIQPYIGGEEVNTHPAQQFHRYVINFGDMPLEEAERWPDLIGIVREKVKPERDRKSNTTDARDYAARWWQHAKLRISLYEALRGLPRCLVNSQVSKHLIFAWQPTDRIFGHTLYVYPLPNHAAFAILQSRVHERWARLLSSSMKTDLRYAASDCFDNFPFPLKDPRAEIPALETLGETLYQARAQFMLDQQVGLTKTYNALKDPADDRAEVAHLRRLHEDLDRAVLEAYGWGDVAVPPFLPPTTPEGAAAFQAFEDEIIDRLFALNQTRAEEEARLGLGAQTKRPKPRKPKTTASGQPELDLGDSA